MFRGAFPAETGIVPTIDLRRKGNSLASATIEHRHCSDDKIAADGP
ncbi:hypothetical protein B0G80_1646 [Paraburkholderia sp. BL6669N2]|nr:hypothetical protein B0G80_1646 [Paraburkholderia sp. BL6669N2]